MQKEKEDIPLAGIKNLLSIIDSSLHLLFPPLCIHCKVELKASCKLLCPPCLDLLEFLHLENRCCHCFQESQVTCDTCQQTKPSSDFIASCFEYTGPAKSLIKEFKYGDRPYLASSLSSFLFLQFLCLDWPIPDIITFVPQSFIRTVSRGYNQSELLAKAFAKLLSKPVTPLLKKSYSTFSQSLLTKQQRKNLPQELFSAKAFPDIENKSVLLIDDVYTTGTTVERSSWAIREKKPSHIYVLTVCHAGFINS